MHFGSDAPLRYAVAVGRLPQSRCTISSAVAALVMIAAVDTKEVLKPVSASLKGSSRGRWHEVTVEDGHVTIKGGYNNHAEIAPCIRYQVNGKTRTFVLVDKNAPWFLKGVGGKDTQKGDLKPVDVLKVLRQRFQSHAESPPHPAVAEEGSQESEQYVDPMDAMDQLPGVQPKKAPKKASKVPKPDLARTLVQEITVPTRPKCAGLDQEAPTTVCVYRRPSQEKRGNSALYLEVKDVAWLLAYAADELAFQGVEAASPEPEQAGNCPAVADLYLEWDFDAKAWEGRFVAGEQKGDAMRMSITDLSGEVWDKLRDHDLVQGYFSKASILDKKNAAKEFVTMWGAAIVGNDDNALQVSADIARIIGRSDTSSPRGQKRLWEDPAVADEEESPEHAHDADAVADEDESPEHADV